MAEKNSDQIWTFNIIKKYSEKNYSNKKEALEQFIEDIAFNNFDIEEDNILDKNMIIEYIVNRIMDDRYLTQGLSWTSKEYIPKNEDIYNEYNNLKEEITKDVNHLIAYNEKL